LVGMGTGLFSAGLQLAWHNADLWMAHQVSINGVAQPVLGIF
jgi:hypothetical protein